MSEMDKVRAAIVEQMCDPQVTVGQMFWLQVKLNMLPSSST